MERHNFFDMRMFLIVAIVIITWACKSKNVDYGVNLGVRGDKGDTLSYFYYRGHKDYEFYDTNGADSVFIHKENLLKMPGEFVLGLKSRNGNPYMYLIFKADSTLKIGTNWESTIPFLQDEYSLNRDYEVRVIENRVDTTNYVVRKYETKAAIDKNSKDTILYQETNYFFQGNTIGGTLVVYNNLKTREEMRELGSDAIEQMNESIKKYKKQ